MATQLSDRDRAILDFEREWWRLPGPKEAEVLARFAMSSSSYYRALTRLVDLPAAVHYDPLTVRRLRRQRDRRRRERYEGRRAGPGSR